MTVSTSELLAFVVKSYDEHGRPVTTADATARFDADRAAVESGFGTLVDCELVAGVDRGYRPTVTGRELLDLDMTGDLVIVDANGGEGGPDSTAKF